MTQAIKWENHEEWLNIRSRGIGGSDVSAILGINPWRTPVQVWKEKLGQELPEEKESNALFVGSYLEDCCAKLYERNTGRKVETYDYTLSDGCLQGNVDRLVVPEGKESASDGETIQTNLILECKTTSDYGWDEVPLYYQTQVQHYMGLTGAEACDVAVIYKPTTGFGVFRVNRDDDAIQKLRYFLNDWWERHIVRGIEPEPVNEADCKLLWSKSQPQETWASEEILRAAEKLKFCREEINVLKKEEEIQKSRIAAFMGVCDTLVDPDTELPILTYRTSKPRQVTDLEGVINYLQGKLGYSNDDIADIKTRFTSETAGFRSFNFPRSKKG